MIWDAVFPPLVSMLVKVWFSPFYLPALLTQSVLKCGVLLFQIIKLCPWLLPCDTEYRWRIVKYLCFQLIPCNGTCAALLSLGAGAGVTFWDWTNNCVAAGGSHMQCVLSEGPRGTKVVAMCRWSQWIWVSMTGEGLLLMRCGWCRLAVVVLQSTVLLCLEKFLVAMHFPSQLKLNGAVTRYDKYNSDSALDVPLRVSARKRFQLVFAG